MARFEIYPNPIAADRVDFPFVLDIQSDLLYRFAERVCVPLVRPGAVPGLTERFNPSIAAPIAKPVIASSESGVSQTRSTPNFLKARSTLPKSRLWSGTPIP